MARIFVTGSTDGVGLATARALVADGHTVAAHARTARRADEVRDQLSGVESILIADLASQSETIELAEQVNARGRCDAVIHNAGIGSKESRADTVDGREHVVAINAIAPYILTALITAPQRLIYVTSGQHLNGTPNVDDIDWVGREWNPLQAYADSKLLESTVAYAVARLWPDVITNTMEPGWVPTKMANYDAPDDLALAHVTQVWLAASNDPEVLRSGGYYYHQRLQPANPIVVDIEFQESVLSTFAALTGIDLPRP
ncbi:MAG TPA: SDR family NAD(P)-dependent oxidoreductase [Kribbella sp.]|jgi:NAD(P)-dependent dehydrogenase (short-subunit alcohol dehydrogenase family)